MTTPETAIATIITTTTFNELATTSSQRAPATSQGGTAVSVASVVPAVCGHPPMFLTFVQIIIIASVSFCVSLCLVASLIVCVRRKRGAREALLWLLDPEFAHRDRQHLVDRTVQTATDDLLHSFFCTPSGRRLHASATCHHLTDRVVAEVQVPACVATLLYDSRSLVCKTCS